MARAGAVQAMGLQWVEVDAALAGLITAKNADKACMNT